MVLAAHKPEMAPADEPFDPTLFGLKIIKDFIVSELEQLPSPRIDYVLGVSSIPPTDDLPPNAVNSPAGVQDKKLIDKIDEVGWLLPEVESRRGSLPRFLCEKKLSKTDVDNRQHRLLLSGGERKFLEFLRADETAAVEENKYGLAVMGVDGDGNVYHDLVLKSRGKTMVILSDWMKVVRRNGAEENDVVKIWGFREKGNGRPCLVFKFN